jgi:hypothetical protein
MGIPHLERKVNCTGKSARSSKGWTQKLQMHHCQAPSDSGIFAISCDGCSLSAQIHLKYLCHECASTKTSDVCVQAAIVAACVHVCVGLVPD